MRPDSVNPSNLGIAPDYSGLLAAIGRVACFYGIGIVAAYLNTRMMVYVTQGSLRSLRDEMFLHMETLPIKYFDTHAHGDIMSMYTNDALTTIQISTIIQCGR